MFGNKKEQPYKDSKEYLQKQQDIDYLLILSKLFLEINNNTEKDKEIRAEAGKQISKILDKHK